MASVASALRTAITAANITNITTKVYRNIAPDSETYPFVTFDDDVARVPALFGDGGVLARARTISVDLWQLLDAEDTTLVESLLAAVDGADLTGADLSDAIVTGAYFFDANLTDAIWTDGSTCVSKSCSNKAYD